MDRFDSFFETDGRKAILFYYQEDEGNAALSKARMQHVSSAGCAIILAAI